MLGELEQSGGQIFWNNPHEGIAVVSQDAWIFGGTIRENITFGNHYNTEWYRKGLSLFKIQIHFLFRIFCFQAPSTSIAI